MRKNNYTPRIAFTCTEEQLKRSQKLFSREGLRGEALSTLFDWLMDGVEEHGESFAARVVDSKKSFNVQLKGINE